MKAAPGCVARPPSRAGSAHDHFFATFGKFGLETNEKGEMLAAVATIDGQPNVHLLETLV